MKFITRMRRDRWRDQVLANGRALYRAHRERGMATDRSDLSRIDAEIERRTRKRDRLLAQLRRTA